ncbi:MAG: nuclear transport factor 2 family protein [Acidimicrobiia bacterium]|nr:nuclear transport factor 2 family protein [Acidimicrobiia bacterium]
MSATDGAVPDPQGLADRAAITDLVVAYAHAVDDRDWERWEALFIPDALVDYRSAGGIAGTPAEVARWMPEAMAVFTFCLHSVSTHEIRFASPQEALGRVHVFNRNGVEWEGEHELVDVSATYHDRYVRVADRWWFAERIEHTHVITGGAFADLARGAAVAANPDGPHPIG